MNTATIGTTTSGKQVFDASHPAYELARQELTGATTAVPSANDEDLSAAHAHTAALDAAFPDWTAEDHREAGSLHWSRIFNDEETDENARAAANAHYCAESLHGCAEVKQHGQRIA